MTPFIFQTMAKARSLPVPDAFVPDVLRKRGRDLVVALVAPHNPFKADLLPTPKARDHVPSTI